MVVQVVALAQEMAVQLILVVLEFLVKAIMVALDIIKVMVVEVAAEEEPVPLEPMELPQVQVREEMAALRQ
jgi:hypothetical protein